MKSQASNHLWVWIFHFIVELMCFSISSRVATRGSWSPLSGLKGVQPPLPFGERTRDCSPGHAGKEGPYESWLWGAITPCICLSVSPVLGAALCPESTPLLWI